MAVMNVMLLLACRPGQILEILHWFSIFLKQTPLEVFAVQLMPLLLFNLAAWGQEVANLRLNRQCFHKGKPGACLAAGVGKRWR